MRQKMKKGLLFILLFLSTYRFAMAQSHELRSIRASLPHLKDSTRYVDALNRMAMLLYENNVDSTFYYTIRARETATRLHYDQGKADATNNLGVFLDIKGNHQLAVR